MKTPEIGVNVTDSDCRERPVCTEKALCTPERFTLANEITTHLLETAPGDFGRLVLLSSLSNPSAYQYCHPAFENSVPPCLASLVLQGNHKHVFSRWLKLTLEEQWKAVTEYLATEQARGVEGSFETLIPGTARPAERELFVSDLKLILSLSENQE